MQMNDSELKWTVEKTTHLLHTPVFDVTEQQEVSGTGLRGNYIAMNAPDWIVVVPVYGDSFVMVRQWRHAEQQMTWEIPGGVMNEGETPAEAAGRELLEETGFRAGKLTELGRVSSNPALFSNHFTVFLAEELEPTGEQHLDDDELVNYALIPQREVLASYGSPEYSHPYMGTALLFYLRHLGRTF